MIFRQLFDRESSTYSYLIASRGQAVLIDPVKEQLPTYLRLIDEFGLKLVYALDTHVHADHVTALGDLRRETQCVTAMGDQTRAECVSRKLKDREVLQVGDVSIEAWHTPGHTDDSVSYVMDDRVFTGDTLLIRGTGRTDFQNGDAGQLYHSIFDKLLTLPDETWVYPGHDYRGQTVSTIGEERAFNPRLRVRTEAEFRAIMDALELPNPKLMDVAVPANLSCGRAA